MAQTYTYLYSKNLQNQILHLPVIQHDLPIQIDLVPSLSGQKHQVNHDEMAWVVTRMTRSSPKKLMDKFDCQFLDIYLATHWVSKVRWSVCTLKPHSSISLLDPSDPSRVTIDFSMPVVVWFVGLSPQSEAWKDKTNLSWLNSTDFKYFKFRWIQGVASIVESCKPT